MTDPAAKAHKHCPCKHCGMTPRYGDAEAHTSGCITITHVYVPRALVADGIEAFRLTREYVGEDTLPDIEGWSWFDWTQKAAAYLATKEPNERHIPPKNKLTKANTNIMPSATKEPTDD